MSSAAQPSCVILGGGGHAAVLIDTMRQAGMADPVAIVDPQPGLHGTDVLTVPIRGGDAMLPELRAAGAQAFLVGAGSVGATNIRARLFELACQVGLQPLTVRHPSAIVSTTAQIGEGSQLLAACFVGTRAVLGHNVLVNTAAIVEHDCTIGDHTHLATGCRLGGAVRVGMGAHIGIGATVKQGMAIGQRAVVGAGAVVIRDVPDGAVVVGVPARPIQS